MAIRCFRLTAKRIGEITSGSPCAVFEEEYCAGLCAGRVMPGWMTEVAVEIRGQMVKAKVVAYSVL